MVRLLVSSGEPGNFAEEVSELTEVLEMPVK